MRGAGNRRGRSRQRLRKNFPRAQPASGLGGASAELRQHPLREGRRAGSGGGTTGPQRRRPDKRTALPGNYIPLKQLSETVPEKEVATSLRAPKLVLPTLAPGRSRGPRVGSGFSAVAKRAGTQVTRPPGPRPRGRTLPGRELAPGLRAKFHAPATSLAQGPRAGPGARRRSRATGALRPPLTWPPGAGGVRIPGLAAGRCAAEEREAGGRG